MTTRGLALVLCALVAGCGDDNTGSGGSGGSGGADAGIDSGSGGTGGTDGGNPFISTAPGVSSVLESETSIAADGNGKLVGVWIGEGGGSFTGYRVSTNNGASWLDHPQRIDAPDARISSDPVVAVDSQGTFYAVWLGYRQPDGNTTNDMHVYYAKMAPGTTTFDFNNILPVDNYPDMNTPTGTPPVNLDKPWITVDASDNIYVTWMNLRRIFVAKKGPQDASFSAPLQVSNSGGNLAYPCVDRPNGTLYVVWFDAGSVRLAKSTDGAATFPTQTVVASNAAFEDPTCVAQNNNVWVSLPVGAGGGTNSLATLTAVVVAHSSNGGTSFGTPVTVNPQSSDNYLLPQIQINAAGTLAMAYYAGTENQPAILKKAVSMDGGNTWTVADLAMPGTFTTNRLPNQGWLGDYIGLTPSGSGFVVTYANNTRTCSGGTTPCPHISFASF